MIRAFYSQNKGMALIVSFLVIVVLLILGGVFLLRSVVEKKSVDVERNSIQAFYLSEGGANTGLEQLDLLVNTDLMATVNAMNPNVFTNQVSGSGGYVSKGDGIGFLYNYTKEGGAFLFTYNNNNTPTNYDDDNVTYQINSTALGAGAYSYLITITEKGNPAAVPGLAETWDFPYKYSISSTGAVSSLPRKVTLEGDFTVRVQKDNFARYALFTNQHHMESGTDVWFTNRTSFTGPVHTNDRLSFALNPSGTFDGVVTQHLTTARFYNNGWPVIMDAGSNPPLDVPTFNAGYTRGVAEINLASSVTQQDLEYQAKGQQGGSYSDGIYVPNNGSNVTAGIFVKGDSNIVMSVDANDDAVYTITQGSATDTITVDYDYNNGQGRTTVNTGSGPVYYGGIPNGVDDLGVIIYTDGAVNSLQGTVQRQSSVTISSQNDIVITNNVVYEQFDSGPPLSAAGTDNLLGILSWGGDVRIGTTCPDNASVHGVVMAHNGIFAVDNYDSGSPRGTFNLLGGVISQFYGAFGTFSSQTGLQATGYGRNFVYDDRMAQGNSPPYFPTINAFIAFSNDITDRINWQEGVN